MSSSHGSQSRAKNMKLRIWSDVHNEFGKLKWTPREDDKDTVLVIAGDWTVWNDALQAERDSDLLVELHSAFRAIVYVAGNHEYYHGGVIQDVNAKIQAFALQHENFYFLQNDFCVIEGVRFIGATFWTDYKQADEDVMWYAYHRMNDYRQIMYFDVDKDTACSLQPKDLVSENAKSRDVFGKLLTQDEKIPTVVVTHHLPDYKHVNGYADGGLEYAYGNTDTESFFEFSNLKLWIHGHVHVRQEYLLGNTWVVANPRGYIGHQTMAYTFADDKIWEVS
jgi:Icc-related predicted phosphoesterase